MCRYCHKSLLSASNAQTTSCIGERKKCPHAASLWLRYNLRVFCDVRIQFYCRVIGVVLRWCCNTYELHLVWLFRVVHFLSYYANTLSLSCISTITDFLDHPPFPSFPCGQRSFTSRLKQQCYVLLVGKCIVIVLFEQFFLGLFLCETSSD